MGAASRRASRAQEQRQRAVAKGLDRADRYQTSFDAETERELERVKKYESSIRETPISTLRLAYESEKGWSTAPFGDQTGRITYELTVKLPTYDVVFDPESVDIDGLTLIPLAFSAADFGTFLAFKLTAASDANLKLVHKSQPDQGRMALAPPSGALMFATESSLDGRLFGGTWKVGVVSFPPFQSTVETFEVIVSGKGKRSRSVRLRVSGDTVAEHMGRCLTEPSITARFEAMLRGKQAEVRENVSQAKASLRKAGSGCIVILTTSTLLLGGLVALASALR